MAEHDPDRRDGLEISTWAVRGGRPDDVGAPLNHPPVAASNFRRGDSSDEPLERIYSRAEGTDATEGLELLLGGLDGGRALCFSSGMAAAANVFDALPVGSHVVLPTLPYHGVGMLADAGERLGRWTVERIDAADTERWVDACGRAELIWLESPENPLLTVADLPAVCAAPRGVDSTLVVDSTFATPMLQRPLEFGADVVMHSATKFLGGHSDLLAGVLVFADDASAEQARDRRTLGGATIGMLEAFLVARGVRTLPLRVEAGQANASELAHRLEADPRIARVRYPGLRSHPTHRVAAGFMNGFGALISFEVAAGGAAAQAVCERVELIAHATSLGGVESSMERRAAIPGQEMVPAGLVRLSVGCEAVSDLWSDLDRALGTRGGH